MKAVLVIDNPENCGRCPLGRFMDDNKMFCEFKVKDGFGFYSERDRKPKWCPLKPVPSEYCVNHNGDGDPDWWAVGYNRAIRDIAGEEDG